MLYTPLASNYQQVLYIILNVVGFIHSDTGLIIIINRPACGFIIVVSSR